MDPDVCMERPRCLNTPSVYEVNFHGPRQMVERSKGLNTPIL